MKWGPPVNVFGVRVGTSSEQESDRRYIGSSSRPLRYPVKRSPSVFPLLVHLATGSEQRSHCVYVAYPRRPMKRSPSIVGALIYVGLRIEQHFDSRGMATGGRQTKRCPPSKFALFVRVGSRLQEGLNLSRIAIACRIVKRRPFVRRQQGRDLSHVPVFRVSWKRSAAGDLHRNAASRSINAGTDEKPALRSVCFKIIGLVFLGTAW